MANILKPKRRTADTTAPTTANLVDGELAVNIPSKTIYMRNGANVVPISNFYNAIISSDTAPATPAWGQEWFDTSVGRKYTWINVWVELE